MGQMREEKRWDEIRRGKKVMDVMICAVMRCDKMKCEKM